ncbi:hypothetical protein DDE82_003320 [Stemphylium lycopersici]|nr:hypothetical protein DDE82_003320 [Stemphylium lycopersici]
MASQEENDPGSQPHMTTGDSLSQPLMGEANKLLQKTRRTISDREENAVRFGTTAMGHLPKKPFESLQQLKVAVWNVLIERLRLNGVTSSRLQIQHFHWCLPTSLEHEAAWRLLLIDPFSVNLAMLSNMMTLVPSNPDSDRPPRTPNSIYIRTYSILVKELRDIFQCMLHDGFNSNSNMFSCLERLQEMEDNDYVTLRYCGQTSGVDRPWERHVSDIYKTSLKTWLAQFHKTLGLINNDIISGILVHAVYKACSAEGVRLSPDIVDLREQILIALFGDGVLNTEFGGKDIIVLTPDHHQAFDFLKTNFVKQITSTGHCPTTMKSSLRKYARKVMQYAKSHPTTTTGEGKTRHSFSDETKAMLVEQGMSRVMSDGSAIMVSVGSDLGDTHEDDDKAFFQAGGRSADVVKYVYNHFAHWESGILSGPLDKDFTERLANQNGLPFTDVFPWFVKHKGDCEQGSKFLGDYMRIVTPYIVVTYGQLPSFAGSQNFASFTWTESQSYQTEARKAGGWIASIGRPFLANFYADQDDSQGHECVIVPCLHPGAMGYAGIMKDKLSSIFVLGSAIAWKAATIAMHENNTSPALSRKEKCQKVISGLASYLDVNNPFGKTLQKAKDEYVVAYTAYQQGRVSRGKSLPLPPPVRGLLAVKTKTAKKRHISQDVQTTDNIGDGFEVLIQEQLHRGLGGKDNVRYRLTWKEDDGQEWSIAPVIMPNNVFSSRSNEKYFLFYTIGGLDLRTSDNTTLGDRKPLINGNTKLETLPIASLVISLAEQANAPAFFLHWEEITACAIDDVLSSKLPRLDAFNANEPYYPKSFFDASRSKRALPLTIGTLTSKSRPVYFSVVRAQLPANPGDLFWLFHRFFEETFPEGGDIDPLSPSIFPNSVFLKIANFCAKGIYRHHTHIRTLFAFASMSEMGIGERWILDNILWLAGEILRGVTSKKKTANMTIKGKRVSAIRNILVLSGNRKQDVISEEDDPELEQDVKIHEDFTDDEDDDVVYVATSPIRGKKRSREGDEDGADQSSKASSKAAKGKQKARVEEEDDDDIAEPSKAAAPMSAKAKGKQKVHFAEDEPKASKEAPTVKKSKRKDKVGKVPHAGRGESSKAGSSTGRSRGNRKVVEEEGEESDEMLFDTAS